METGVKAAAREAGVTLSRAEVKSAVDQYRDRLGEIGTGPDDAPGG